MYYSVIHNITNIFGEKVNKIVIECNTQEEAEQILTNLRETLNYKIYRVKNRPTKPSYNMMRYNVRYINSNDLSQLNSLIL